jgi:hypothetical protein
MRKLDLILGAALAAMVTTTAQAHKPSFGGPYARWVEAYDVADTSISIVVYQELTCEYDEVWLRFEAKAGEPLFFQLGVPVVDRLEAERPAIALLAPGLPPVDLPFALPPDVGGQVWRSDDVETPSDFFEPFTQTASWVWIEQTITLPEDGDGYLVAYIPAGTNGKAWVAVGTVEDFSNVDPTDFVGWARDVNDFHETGKYSEPPTAPLASCAEPSEEAPEAGCASTSGLGSGWIGLLGALLVRRPRRTPAD